VPLPLASQDYSNILEFREIFRQLKCDKNLVRRRIERS